ncbi:protein FAM228B-like [Mixophyes fleayi]|uniref:protein FAM228B-like n=1 Tax=Mixophyes fleayi TaxID=3061075 RepID=UPI003F4DADFE
MGKVSPNCEMMSGCRRVMKEGVITTQTAQLPKDLLPGPERTKSAPFRKPKKITPSCPVSLSTTSLRKTSDWLVQKPHVQLLVNEESKEINAMTQCVLNTEHQYNQSIEEFVRRADSAELRRKEIQHKRWTERVAEPLQKTIERYVDGQSSEDIESRRRHLLAQYLKYCNKKGSAFMRDYDSSEYDPFINRLCKQYLRVPTPLFQDPLLQQYEKRYEEERIALHCETGRLFSAKEIRDLNLQKLPQVPLGRQTVNGFEWLKTPFGYIESETRQKSRQKVRGSCNQGTLDFKVWKDSKCPPDIFGTEMKIFHKRQFPERLSSSLPAYSKHWGPDVGVDMITI